ncbi:hypothetical protein N431DRAFT_477626 [Stipitochalara longipes BDJ]|nr:hypothetical protein N431DRAFT_477626 [Stipitochalara longipes BDJ]
MSGEPLQNLDSQGRDIERLQAFRNHQSSSMDDNSELWEQYPEGYPRFAAFLAHDDDKSTTIFRRFERLATRNLLYLESELFELEAKQDQLDESDWKDAQSTVNLRRWEPTSTAKITHARDTEHRESASSSKEIATPEPAVANGANAVMQERSEVAYSIRRGIKEYYKALKLYHEILHLEHPNRQALTNTRLVLLNNDLSNSKSSSSMLEGQMASHLDGKYKNDLCLAGPAIQQDSLVTFIEEQLGWIFKDSKHPHRNRALILFPRRNIQAVAAFIGVAFFMLMFLGSLFVLWFMRGGLMRLALISMMTVSLVSFMALFTRSTRIEIFGAVIGYLMITTIFVGNSGVSMVSSTPFVSESFIPGESSNYSTPASSNVPFTTIEVLQPAETPTSSSNQQSAALGNSASIATIAGTAFTAIGLVFTVIASIYQCRKYLKKRRDKKTSTP